MAVDMDEPFDNTAAPSHANAPKVTDLAHDSEQIHRQ
jgi:hypothetical protein